VKNIIVIITDTFRYDNLDPGAGVGASTPELHRFGASRATSVRNFFAGSVPTIPHRSDFATGTLGWPHYGWQSIKKSSPNHIAALLGSAGYVTQLIADTPHIFTTRFHEAFQAHYQVRGQESDRPLLHLNDSIRKIVPEGKDRPLPKYGKASLLDLHRWINRYSSCESETYPAKTSQIVIRWLEENYRQNPFLLWLDLFDPHEPWDPPEYLVARYDPEYKGIPMLSPNYGFSSEYSKEELNNLRAHYAAEVEIVDRYVGRILQKIDDLQLWDDSIVVLTSDHGMSIGEHQQTGKANRNPEDPRYWPLYPELAHVPFYVAGAEVPKGIELDLVAQPIDILPTLCDLAVVDLQPEQPFEGRSFAPAVLEGSGKHRDYAVSGCHAFGRDSKLLTGGLAGVFPANTPFVIQNGWGYTPIGQEGKTELYNLVEDPLAEHNVAENHEDVLPQMHSLLVDHLREHQATEEFIRMWES
jgi:arylsulfatase A-like enzyme